MKRSQHILVLLFFFTGYMLSQNVIDEEINLGNSFYKSYLDENYFVYSMRNNITEINDDTLVIKKEKVGIISTELLISSNEGGFSPFPTLSLSIKAPIFSNFHIIIKDWVYFSGSIRQQYHYFSLMIGYYSFLDKNKKFIGEIATGFGIGGFMLAMPVSVNIYCRVFKNILLSFGLDFTLVGSDVNITPYFLSLGLGITY